MNNEWSNMREKSIRKCHKCKWNSAFEQALAKVESKLGREPFLAEDIVQDVLIRAFLQFENIALAIIDNDPYTFVDIYAGK